MPDAATLSTSDSLMASLQALPIGVHVVLGAGMAAGLVLWLAGSRVARPMFGLIGVVFGASLGFFLAPLLALEPVHDIPTPYLGLGVGGLVGLTIAVALFRFTMAIAAAAVLALAGMSGASVYMDRQHPAPQADATSEFSTNAAVASHWSTEDRTRMSLESAAFRTAFGAATDQTEWARQTAERTREFLGQAGSAAQGRWETVPGEHRLMVAAGGLGGGVFGFLLGVFVPRRAAALVTALAGSAMWLACAAWTAHATGAPGLELLNQPKQVWLVIWPATAAVGILVQWIGMVKGRNAGG